VSGRRALITGVTGQDGSYLAELLLDKGYEVYGLVRRLSTPNVGNIGDLLAAPGGGPGGFHVVDGDLADQASLERAVRLSEPDEVYNLAAQSFVGVSFNQPVLTGDVTGLGAVRMLEAVRLHADKARFYQASSSEMFGNAHEEPQSELTPFCPRSPYGAAKVFAHNACRVYREAHGMFVSTGILFNHESERRGLEFVTRHISRSVARIAAGQQQTVELGDLTAVRDWGYAPDYVDLMWRILQHPRADDFVGATGESNTVGGFLEEACRVAGVGRWEGLVSVAKSRIRPAEVYNLRGDAGKAHEELGWAPRVRFRELVRIMVEADMARLGVAALGTRAA
jgi:GDPmannose 4,6-dehydratase